jgi:predicted MFS family arabinose efflux permease
MTTTGVRVMSRRSVIALIFGSIVITLSMGIRQIFGLLLLPVTTDLAMSREAFGIVIGLQNLLWGVTQPVTGLLADRYGAGRIIAAGGLLYAAGLALAGCSVGRTSFGMTIGALIGLAQSGTAYAVVLGAIARATPASQRSLALGIASTAGSIGMFTLVPLTEGLVLTFDWRWALMVLGGLAALMPIMAAGLRESTAAVHSDEAMRPRQMIAIAARQPGFWMLNAGFAACGFQLAFLATHLPSILVGSGLTASTGAAVLATIGLSNIVGTYVCGLLGVRFRKNRVLAWLYLARTALFVLFLSLPTSQASALIFAAAIGLIWTGTVPLTSGLVGDIFGVRHLGLLFGTVYLGHQIGAFVGAWAGGLSFDRTGSYAAVWAAAILMGLLAALLHWPIRDAPLATSPAPAWPDRRCSRCTMALARCRTIFQTIHRYSAR